MATTAVNVDLPCMKTKGLVVTRGLALIGSSRDQLQNGGIPLPVMPDTNLYRETAYHRVQTAFLVKRRRI